MFMSGQSSRCGSHDNDDKFKITFDALREEAKKSGGSRNGPL